MSKLMTDFLNKFWGNVVFTDDCWLWIGSRTKKGYGSYYAGNRRVEHAHRVAYKLAYGDYDPNLHVLHRCDNPPCVNPKHLFLGTNYDNVMDRVRKNRGSRPLGESNPNAKLSWAQVEEIRRRVKGGESQNSLTKIFPVTSTMMSRIARELNWKMPMIPS